jgi:hypothetical protein
MSEPISRYRGDTIPDEITVVDNAGGPFNLTGCVLTMTVNRRRRPASSLGTLYALTGVLTNATAGVAEFRPAALDADQVPGTYYYDIQLFDTNGRIQTIAAGTYTYTQDLTKT